MTHLLIRNPGLFTTIQDFGRLSYQHVGVPVSGAVDILSLQIANALVGNSRDHAAFEAFAFGPELEAVGGAARIAWAGGVCDAQIIGENPRRVQRLQSITLYPGEILRIGPIKDASCVYVAVEGGFAIAPILGSRSTYVRGRIGGLEGRTLKPGDEIPLAVAEAEVRPELELADSPDFGSGPFRVVMGPQDDYFTEEGKNTLLDSEYKVSNDVDRVGMRLIGPAIKHARETEMPSDGTVNGNIQIPGSGEPIVLLPDRSTTGGYPKIATVISAELPRLSRLLPGQPLRFVAISQKEAIDYTRQQHRRFADTLQRIRPVSQRITDSSELLGLNLVGGVVSAEYDSL